MTKFGHKPEWKIEIGATPISMEMQEAFNITLDRNVTNQCSILSCDINNVGGKYKSTISNYDEIKLYTRYSGDSWVQEFGGHIDKLTYRKTGEGDVLHIDARCYMQKFFFKLINKYYENECVEDIIKDIVDEVNTNIATNFEKNGIGNAYEQATINDESSGIYGCNSGGSSTLGQTFKPTKENVITIDTKILRVGSPSNLICTMFEWDTNYATTAITSVSGESIAADDATKVFNLDRQYVHNSPAVVVKRDGSPWGTEDTDYEINYILGIITFDTAPSTSYTWTIDYSCDNYNKVISRETTTNTDIPAADDETSDNPLTTTQSTIIVLDAVGLDTTKEYLLDFRLASTGDGSNYYKFGIHDTTTLSNGYYYEADGSALNGSLYIKFNSFNIDADDKNAFEVMRDICNRLGYDWYSDTSYDIQLKPRNITATETVITGEDIISVNYCRDITPLANKIYVYGKEYPIHTPSEFDEYTEPANQAWVDSNWKANARDGITTGTDNMIDEDNIAAFGEKFIELSCSNKTQNDYLKYPNTDDTDDGVADNRHHTIYFVMRAGDKAFTTPVKIILEIKVHDNKDPVGSDTFKRDIIATKGEWQEHQFKLPHINSDEGWTGVSRYIGKRWENIQHIKWYVSWYDKGSTGDTYDTVDIYDSSNYVGQKFRAADTDIIQIIVKGRKDGTPAGALKCQVYEWDTNYATTIAGTLIASGTLAAASITGSDTELTIPITMETGQSLTEGTDYLLHFTDSVGGINGNEYILLRDTATNENGRYYADGSYQSGQSIYFLIDYQHRHADYIGIDGLTFVGSDIIYASVQDVTSQSNFDTREYVIRKEDITSTDEALQKAKQTLRHLGYGDDSWTGNPGDTKDIQNNGFVVVPGRNDLTPTDSVKIQYSEADLDCDFRIDSISHSLSKYSGWVTTLRLAMILPQMSVQEMLQHIITSVNEIKLRKPTYEKGLSGSK